MFSSALSLVPLTAGLLEQQSGAAAVGLRAFEKAFGSGSSCAGRVRERSTPSALFLFFWVACLCSS